MMARSHESTSALAWMGVVVVTTPHLRLSQVAAGLVVAAGAGILPDLDKPGASPSRALWFVSRQISRLVAYLAGGHRQKTHTLVLTAAVGFLVWLSEQGRSPWPTVCTIGVLALFTARVLGPRSTRHSVVASVGLAVLFTWLVYRYVPISSWVWWAVVAGYAGHLGSDLLSVAGEPLLWPLTNYRFRVPGDPVPMESRREHWIASLSLCGVAFLFYGIAR